MNNSSGNILIQEAINTTLGLLKNSYSPYSNFAVAATIISDDDQMFSGVNVENASYSLCICAESSAIAHMISSKGLKKIRYVIIANRNNDSCPPCGACLQRISEFATPDTTILLVNNLGKIESSYNFHTLLPTQFNSKYLK